MLNAWIQGFLCGCLAAASPWLPPGAQAPLGACLGLHELARLGPAVFILLLAHWFFKGQSLSQKGLLCWCLRTAGFGWGWQAHAPVSQSPPDPMAVIIARAPGNIASQLVLAGSTGKVLAFGPGARGQHGFLGQPSRSSPRLEFRPATTPPSGSALTRWFQACKEFLQTRLHRQSREDQAWLSPLLLGQYHDLPVELALAFRRLGVFHLLVVSGLHVGLLARVGLVVCMLPARIFLALRWLQPGWPWTLCRVLAHTGVIFCLLGYIGALGFPAAATRAWSVWGCAQLSGIFWGRQPQLRRSLLSVVIQSLIAPVGWLSAANFMSWLAYLIVVHTQALLQKPNLGHRLWVTVQSQVVLLAATAMVWGEVSGWGLVANLLLVPLFPVVFLLSLVSLFPEVFGQGLIGGGRGLYTLFADLCIEFDRLSFQIFPKAYWAGLSPRVRWGAAVVVSYRLFQIYRWLEPSEAMPVKGQSWQTGIRKK